MNIDVIRISILTAYGNAYLQGKKVSFDKNHPAAYNHRNIKFIQDIQEDHIKWNNYLADNPNEWFKYLKENNYSRLYLSYSPSSNPQIKDHQGAAFVGGGSQWCIIAMKGDKCDVWSEKHQAERGEQMIYFYLSSKDKDLPKIQNTPLDKVKLYLREILKDLVDFTIKSELKNWQNVFQKSLLKLTVENEDELLDIELLPENCFSLEAKQILATCDKAWVFGGMGSWNDVVKVHNYDLYTRLTANLYDTICKSIAAAINSYPEE
ncbi:MAG: hypothetical protein FK733_12460 [Asgard group archaeon]|nr:hypothetical protein [Asgard group archaeon]